MEVWFSMKIAWKISLETNQSPRKLKFTDLPYGILLFQGRRRILLPSACMDKNGVTHYKVVGHNLRG